MHAAEKISPCFGCSERHRGCHVNCEAYFGYKEKEKENKLAYAEYWNREIRNAHLGTAKTGLYGRK